MMTTKTFSAAGALFAIAMLAGCAGNSDSVHMASSQHFVQEASIGNNFEIVSSQIALRKSHNSQIRAFAQKMIDDHSAAERDLRNAVNASMVDRNYVANELDAAHQAKIDKLKSESGRAFDVDYVNAQREAHSDAVRLFRYYRVHGRSDALRQFAIDALPDLEQHERRVYALQP